MGSTYFDQFEYLKSLVQRETHNNLKLTLTAPNWYYMRCKEGRAYPKDVYKNDEEYFAAITKAYQDELRILYEHA